jgi:hypothetical protein
MYIWDHLREKVNYKQTNGYHRQIITNNRVGPLEKKTRKKKPKSNKQSTNPSTLSHKTTTTHNVGVKFCFHFNKKKNLF